MRPQCHADKSARHGRAEQFAVKILSQRQALPILVTASHSVAAIAARRFSRLIAGNSPVCQ